MQPAGDVRMDAVSEDGAQYSVSRWDGKSYRVNVAQELPKGVSIEGKAGEGGTWDGRVTVDDDDEEPEVNCRMVFGC